ncbi:hypothetical protein [uncultured Sphingomonas sp.]|uniref:hypothetical protein n=1 Tax=uncultured Sphingomonas sp. TaxID=158754 RepID=UPI0025CBBEE2|nr:hypothetical protein [uncultured Sphingomonas sp.]
MSIRPQLTPIGPVHVRMTGVVRGDQKGPGIGIVNAPTAAEATAELHRVARVVGADKVVSVASDYRRAALAGGTASTQWRIEVQAWGTAMGPAKPDAAEEPQDPQQQQEADKARDADAAKKAQQAQARATDDAKASDAAKAADAADARKAEVPAAPAPAAQAAPAPATPAPPVVEASAPSPAPAPESPPVSTSER